MNKMSIIFIMLIMHYKYSNGQEFHPKFTDSCSKISKYVAYWWKNDSLANNGFRDTYYTIFLTCKCSSETIDDIVKKYGPPNKINITNKSIDYIYYYFDSRNLPKQISEYGASY